MSNSKVHFDPIIYIENNRRFFIGQSWLSSICPVCKREVFCEAKISVRVSSVSNFNKHCEIPFSCGHEKTDFNNRQAEEWQVLIELILNIKIIGTIH